MRKAQFYIKNTKKTKNYTELGGFITHLAGIYPPPLYGVSKYHSRPVSLSRCSAAPERHCEQEDRAPLRSVIIEASPVYDIYLIINEVLILQKPTSSDQN